MDPADSFSINDANPMDEDAYEISEELEETQSTQSTQQTQQVASQPPPPPDLHLWGYLQPCNPALARIDFWKIHPGYSIGRNPQTNAVVLPGFKISNHHCTVTWDGREDINSNVIVRDLSSNGTFINGSKIGRDQTRILRDGNEIAFGTTVTQPTGTEDYRFVFRNTAGGPPTEGLHAFYDISSDLGKGSFATVRKAICRSTGEWFAVKMIHDKGRSARADTARNQVFAREIAIMEKLKHPNICELKEVFFQQGNDNIDLVLELVEGGDLLEYILQRNGLSEVDSQHITYQICQALSYIHSVGVAHRDLKPENILLTKEKPPVVKVADFGLAKIADSLTMLRTMCGTPSYLAPEVVKQENEEGYDNRVDSWSVGVIVFSMLTNAGPFNEDMNQPDIRLRIAERTVNWSILTDAHVSPEAQDFIRQLLEENPLYRMSLTEALQHPWLTSYTPVYNFAYPPPGPSSGPSTVPRNRRESILPRVAEASGSSIPSGATYGLLGLEMDSSMEIPGMTYSKVKHEGSRLQRRAEVLAQAAEGGAQIPQPSQDMIDRASQEDQSHVASSSKGPAKRPYSEMAPVLEDSMEDADMNAGSPSNKNSDEENFKKGRAVRGKTRAEPYPPPSTRKNGKAAEEKDQMIRRSSRNPPNKQARLG